MALNTLAPDDLTASVTTPPTARPPPWPAALPDQVRAVALVLTSATAPLPLPAVEARFKGRGPWKNSLPCILDTLEALGHARREGEGWLSVGKARKNH